LSWGQACSIGLGPGTTPDPYHGFRFPAGIIAHAVWLYHCFSLSLREGGFHYCAG
jgi:hypothetical protein